MEEINDLTRIISITLEGMRFGAVASKESLKMLGRLAKTIYCALKYDRVRTGKVKGLNPVKKMLKMDQNVSYVKVSQDNLEKFEMLAKKHGIYFTKMPSFGNESDSEASNSDAPNGDAPDGDAVSQEVVHIMYHASAAPRMENVMRMLQEWRYNELDGKETMEEYMKRSGMEELLDRDFLDELKEKYPDQYEALNAMVSSAKKNEITEELIKEGLADNNLLEERQSEANMSLCLSSEQIVKENREAVMIRTSKNDDSYLWIEKKDLHRQKEQKDVILGIIPKNKELHLTNFDETEHYMIKGKDVKRYIDARYEPITISKQIIHGQTETQYMTRIPGTKGELFLCVDKNQTMEEHGGKSIKTFLDMKATYRMVDKNGIFMNSISGRELYAGHYDPFEKRAWKKNAGRKIEQKALSI